MFFTALRGLQVVCYGWSLGNGDKADGARSREKAPAANDEHK